MWRIKIYLYVVLLLFVHSSVLGDGNKALEYYKAGENYYASGDYGQALKSFRLAVEEYASDGTLEYRGEANEKIIKVGRGVRKEVVYEKLTAPYYPNKKINEIELLLAKREKENAERERLARMKPASLQLSLDFKDGQNSMVDGQLDAGESGLLEVSLYNKGEGPGVNVVCTSKVDPVVDGLTAPPQLEFGDIQVGKTIKLNALLAAAYDLPRGIAAIKVECLEGRGYDVRKGKEIRLEKLEPPDLKIARVEINDKTSGFAEGNGNGIPENGETLELKVYLQNAGTGPALGVIISPSGVLTGGAKWITSKVEVGTIQPGEGATSKLGISIPRGFRSSELSALIKVKEKRGLGQTEYKKSIEVAHITPKLNLSYDIVTQQDNVQVKKLKNGEKYQLNITYQNYGAIAAKNVLVRIATPSGVELDRKSFSIDEIAPDANKRVLSCSFLIPRTFGKNKLEGEISFVQDDFESQTLPFQAEVELRRPIVMCTPSLTGVTDGRIVKGTFYELELLAKNLGNIPATGVRIDLKASEPGIVFDNGSDSKTVEIGQVLPNSPVEPIYVKFQAKARGLNAGIKYLSIAVSQDYFQGNENKFDIMVLEPGFEVDRIQESISSSSGQGQRMNSIQDDVSVIAVKTPRDGERFEDEKITVAGEVSGRGAIGNLIVSVNNIRQPQIVVSDSEAGKVFRCEVALSEGNNIIIVSATNRRGQTTQIKRTVFRQVDEDIDVAPVYAANKKPKAVGVIIGISRYKKPTTPTVDYAKRDAEVVRDYLLAMGYQSNNILIAYDDQASFATIKSYLGGSQLKNKIDKDGLSDVFIYYSGHGAPSLGDDDKPHSYLMPYDADVLPESGLAIDDVKKNLSALKVKSIVLVIDACFSGQSEKGQVLEKASYVEIDYGGEEDVAVKNLVEFSATSPKQMANWYDEKRHGIFTYYFLKAIRGAADANADKAVSVDEVQEYLSGTVNDRSRKAKNRDQTPQVLHSGMGAFNIAEGF